MSWRWARSCCPAPAGTCTRTRRCARPTSARSSGRPSDLGGPSRYSLEVGGLHRKRAGTPSATAVVRAARCEGSSMLELDQGQLANIIRSDVYDSDGSKIGRAGQIYVDDETGEPEWVTVNTGLFGTN